MSLPAMVGEIGGTGTACLVAAYLIRALLKAWSEDRKESKEKSEKMLFEISNVKDRLDQLLAMLR